MEQAKAATKATVDIPAIAEDVTRRIQRACNAAGSQLTVDGKFGPMTAGAVLFQAQRLAQLVGNLRTAVGGPKS